MNDLYRYQPRNLVFFCYRKSDIGNCSWLCIPEDVADVRTAFISVKDQAELINDYNAGVEEHQC